MKPITIIISDGIKTSIIIDGKRINGVGEVSFHHKAAEVAEIDVRVTNAAIGPSDVSLALLNEAANQLGYELAPK